MILLPSRPLRVVVADDSTLLRDGVASLLADNGFEVVGQADSLDTLVAIAATAAPDLVVTDIRMPPGGKDEGIVAAGRIQSQSSGRTTVLLLSQYLEVEFALRLLEKGDRGLGYLLKDRIVATADFIDAARRVAGGGSVVDPAIVAALLARRRRAGFLDTLTERERGVLRLMAEGRSNAGIADELFLAEKTVEGYVGLVFDKLGLEPAGTDHRRVLAVLTYLRDQ